jgi:7,8-dihydroneopterin aldolase/epimerase/oxygenase
MAWITLEGMRFHARHGVHEAERVLGTEYIVDVYIKTGIKKAAETDDVANTINYETVFHICQLEMQKPRNLIESVHAAIFKQLKHQFSTIIALRLRIRKLHPPVGGRVEYSSVEDEAEFTTKCPRCGSRFLCYGDETCWCKAITNLHPATQETLTRQYGTTCLCSNCLKLYLG